MEREQLGRFGLLGREGVFPLGQDSLLLGSFASLRPGWSVWDLGCGGGALLLLLAQREEHLTLRGIELDPDAAQLARRNLADNGLAGEILTADLAGDGCRTLPPADLVVSNPPYFSPARGDSGGAARCEERLTLPELCRAAARLTRNGGRFALCYRPERLSELLEELRRAGLEPKRLQFAHHSPEHPPFTLLLECVRQGRPGLEVLPPLFTGGRPQEE